MRFSATLRRTTGFLCAEREVLFAFAASRLLLWAFAWGSWRWFQPGQFEVSTRPALWRLLYHWDAAWYVGIAQDGYSYLPDAETKVAFFPVLPLLLRFLRWVTGLNFVETGFLLANLTLLGSAILLRRLIALDFPSPARAAERAVWLLLFCPVTLFYSSIYTESLFLAASLGAFYLARGGKWLGAGLTGAVLTATRANGVFILLPLIYEAILRQRVRGMARDQPEQSPFWLLLVPAGLLAYMTYLQFRFGDSLAFVHAQLAWGRRIAAPWVGVQDALLNEVPYGWCLLAAAVVAILLCLAAFIMRQRLSYQLYAAASVALLLCSSIYHSLPRYLSVIFPFYLTLASIGQRSEGAYLLAFATSVGLMALCTALFVCGYFIN